MLTLKNTLALACIVAALAVVCCTPLFVSAQTAQQGGFVALSPAPQGSRLAELYGSTSLGDFVNKLFLAAISLGAILAVLRLAFAGYKYMTSDSFGHKSDAKAVIGNALLGLVLLLSIWLILRLINPQLISLDALRNLPSIPASSPAQPQPQAAPANPGPRIVPGAGAEPLPINPVDRDTNFPY